MLSSERMQLITTTFQALGVAHQSQKVDLKLFQIMVKGWGFTPQEVHSWQMQEGYNQLGQEGQRLFRDIFGDHEFVPPVDRN